MQERPKILLIANDDSRTTQLHRVLSRYSQVVFADDLPDALRLLAGGPYEAVFCDWRFHCGTWRDALERIGDLYPELPVVVVSPTEGTEEDARAFPAPSRTSTGAFPIRQPPGAATSREESFFARCARIFRRESDSF